MASVLPYLPSYKNVDKLFEKIVAAKTPEAFTQVFLATTLGLKGSADRALIPLLRTLGFLDASGKPTPAYNTLKGSGRRVTIAEAVRNAYKPLFDANENAHKLSQEDLKGLVAQVAGTDAQMTAKIVGTLNSLLKLGDFETAPPIEGRTTKEEQEEEGQEQQNDSSTKDRNLGLASKALTKRGGEPLHPEFHFNIQVHLPANATEEAYLSMFTALRKAFQ